MQRKGKSKACKWQNPRAEIIALMALTTALTLLDPPLPTSRNCNAITVMVLPRKLKSIVQWSAILCARVGAAPRTGGFVLPALKQHFKICLAQIIPIPPPHIHTPTHTREYKGDREKTDGRNHNGNQTCKALLRASGLGHK